VGSVALAFSWGNEVGRCRLGGRCPVPVWWARVAPSLVHQGARVNVAWARGWARGSAGGPGLCEERCPVRGGEGSGSVCEHRGKWSDGVRFVVFEDDHVFRDE